MLKVPGLILLVALVPVRAWGQSNYTPYTFTTIAGQPGIGSADGDSGVARFNRLTSLAVDSQGNTYVADTGNSTIRKVTPDGVVTTVAGLADVTGSADGLGSAARFSHPGGIAVDNAGNLYVADTGNNTIRKITPTGMVTTLAGLAGSAGFADGTGSAARFHHPLGITVDAAGNVYVSDLDNNTIRKITPAGVVTTLAGVGMTPSVGSVDGTGGDARFDTPRKTAVDSNGNVYVADTANDVIRKITPAGVVTTLAGTAGVRGFADGTGSAALFNHPIGVAVDSSGNVYVADTGNYTIRKITSGGVVTTVAGAAGVAGSTNGTGTAARFAGPTALAVDSSGTVYVVDTGNETIRKVTSGGVVTTLAGLAGTAGITDATGTAAYFNNPLGIAVDGSGNVYVADTSNDTIRKITPGGVVSTFAGLAGYYGITDDTGTAARFYQPQGLAVDSSGNVYVADTRNSLIRKITPDRVVTTIAGTAGIRGSIDGTGSTAEFNTPTGLSVDGAGNLYVADSLNNEIRKITPDGTVTVFAGSVGNAGHADGAGAAAQFNEPAGMTTDGAGNLYVADYGNNEIRKITPDGTVTTVAGSATDQSNPSRDGQIILARFDGPSGVAVASNGTIYVADTSNSEIRTISTDGIVSTLVGSPGLRGLADGFGAGAVLNDPEGVAVDSAGTIYVADTYNNAIRKITPSGLVSTFVGAKSSQGSQDGTGGAARFSNPHGIVADSSGNLYVADTNNDTIRKIAADGTVSTLVGAPGQAGTADGVGSAARFQLPEGVGVDSSGNIYVADTNNETIRKVTPDGTVTTLAGSAGTAGSTDGTGTAASFTAPSGLAVNPTSGTIYVADTANDTIRQINPDGGVSVLAGMTGTPGSVDGTGTAAEFSSPTAVALDSSGNIYVADTGNDTIRKITTTGVVTTLAGSAGTAGSTDGTGTAAAFDGPGGLAVDSSGNVFVADTGNRTIRKITPDGVVTTLAGTAGDVGYTDGTGSAARFSSPNGMTMDASGNIYVCDSGNNTVRKITPAGVVTTLAGSGDSTSKGSADGVGAAARFNEPSSVSVDAAGNLYVADLYNSTIRKITPDGTVSTLAGAPGALGSVDATGPAARFVYASGVASDSSGNVYVADTYDDTIRKITPDGAVTTLAGMAGVVGSTDGTGSSALFSGPLGLAVDGSDNIFVADTGNDTIRKITSDGVVTTLAGTAGLAGSIDGVGSDARFRSPSAVAVDASDNVFVADAGNETIRKITSDGTVTTLAGAVGTAGSQDGSGVGAWFQTPSGIAVDSADNVYVADTDNNLIRKISPSGVVTTLGGLAGVNGSTDGTGSAALFNWPSGIAVDGSGTLYIADTFNNTIRKGVPSGSGSSSSSGAATGSGGTSTGTGGSGSGGTSGSGSTGGTSSTGGTGTSGGSGTSSGGTTGTTTGAGSSSFFSSPVGVTEDAAGNLYIADDSNDVIRKISVDGMVSTLAGSAGVAGTQNGTGTAALFNQPNGVAVDSAGNVYVADTGNSVIRKITAAGVVTTLAGDSSSPSGRGNVDGTGTAAEFNQPFGVAVDSAGNVYVADTYNDTIRKITPVGVVTTLAGMANASGSADGTGTAAQFSKPEGVTVDAAGNLYVADTGNQTIRKITPAGVVTTLAGSAGLSGSNDGTGMYALFHNPVGVTVDGAGDVYVADTGNDLIRVVTPAGVVTTVAGMAGTSGLGDSAGGTVLFNQPQGIMVNSSGIVYVADTGNAVIRRIATDGTVTTLALTSASTSSTSSSSGTSGTSSASASGSASVGGSSSGGGGGAMEGWFVAALILLSLARWTKQESRRTF